MRARNITIIVRLNKEEAEHFYKISKASALSGEEYIRQLIRGVTPQNAPPLEFRELMSEIHIIGNALNEMAKNARTAIDVHRYGENVQYFKNAVERIIEAMYLPRKSV